MTNEELADELSHHCPVGNPTQCKCLFCISARRLREQSDQAVSGEPEAPLVAIDTNEPWPSFVQVVRTNGDIRAYPAALASADPVEGEPVAWRFIRSGNQRDYSYDTEHPGPYARHISALYARPSGPRKCSQCGWIQLEAGDRISSVEPEGAREALERIANHPHSTEGSGDPYNIGVQDGHRCAATIARAALAPQTPAQEPKRS